MPELIDANLVDLDPANFRRDITSLGYRQHIIDIKTTLQIIGLIDTPTVYRSGDRYTVHIGNSRVTAIKELYAEGRQVKGVPVSTIPVNIVEQGVAATLAGLISNTQRRDLNLLEEAKAYEAVLVLPVDTNNKAVPHLTHEETQRVCLCVGKDDEYTKAVLNTHIATHSHTYGPTTIGQVVKRVCALVGKTQPYVLKRLGMLSLVEEVQHMVARGQLSIDFAEAMVGLDANRQRYCVDRWRDSKGRMTLEEFRIMCSQYSMAAQEEMFDLESIWKENAERIANEVETKKKRNAYTGLKADPNLPEMDGNRSQPNTATVIAKYRQRVRKAAQEASGQTVLVNGVAVPLSVYQTIAARAVETAEHYLLTGYWLQAPAVASVVDDKHVV